MKKLSLIVVMSLLFSSLFASCDKDDDDVRIGFESTPAAVQNFVKTHFADINVRYVEKDYDGYDVKLHNDIDLDFTLQGEWTEVDVNRGIMPQSVIDLLPKKLTAYLTEKHADRTIESVSVKAYGYKIDLHGNPDVELIFDSNGNFQRYDD